MIYKNPTPVAVCLIPLLVENVGIRLLGLTRAIEPGLGKVALPGGYVDEGESAEMAAAREAQEETGGVLVTSPQLWRPMMTRTNESNRLLIFCVLSTVLPSETLFTLKPNPEVRGFCWLNPDHCQLGFSLHQAAQDEFYARLSRGELLLTS